MLVGGNWAAGISPLPIGRRVCRSACIGGDRWVGLTDWAGSYRNWVPWGHQGWSGVWDWGLSELEGFRGKIWEKLIRRNPTVSYQSAPNNGTLFSYLRGILPGRIRGMFRFEVYETLRKERWIAWGLPNLKCWRIKTFYLSFWEKESFKKYSYWWLPLNSFIVSKLNQSSRRH